MMDAEFVNSGGMDYNPASTQQRILCCSCGTAIPPNPANMCLACIRNDVDITEGIPKQATIHFCRACDRYLQPPNMWVVATLESRELLTLCIKKLKGLAKVRLVDAGFVWTEPHSRRVKVKLTIQKEVFAATILQQTFIVEFIVANQTCDDCHKVAAQNTWKAVVQVRQKVPHKRTFFFLEQLILKHGAHKDTVNIREAKDGLDFFYASKQHALRMCEFLSSIVPIRIKTSEQLISTDIHASTANYKTTYSIEIIPICKDDLLCLPKTIARSSSNISQLVLCHRVGTNIFIIDPNTCQIAEIRGASYYEHEFRALCEMRDLVEFYVIDIQYESHGSGRFQLATVELCRSQDFMNTLLVRTHLGRVLKPGDHVLGYDLRNSNFNNEEWDVLTQQMGGNLPDVILVKKSYPHRRKKNKSRNWQLRELSKAKDEEAPASRRANESKTQTELDYEYFLRDLEEDPELRGMINLYKTEDGVVRKPNEMEVEEEYDADEEVGEPEEDFPEIQLEELLDGLTLEDTTEV